MTWAVGGGSASQAPDPTHPDELLLIADRPGDLMLHVRVREGLTERRETKSITAVPDMTPAASPFPLRLFLHGWGLVVVAIMVVGFAGALVALGDLTSADFISLVVPVIALLGVLAAVRGTSDPSPQPKLRPASSEARALGRASRPQLARHPEVVEEQLIDPGYPRPVCVAEPGQLVDLAAGGQRPGVIAHVAAHPYHRAL